MEEKTSLYRIDLSVTAFSQIRNCLPQFYKKWNKQPDKMEVSSEIFSQLQKYVPDLSVRPQLFGIELAENSALKPEEVLMKVK